MHGVRAECAQAAAWLAGACSRARRVALAALAAGWRTLARCLLCWRVRLLCTHSGAEQGGDGQEGMLTPFLAGTSGAGTAEHAAATVHAPTTQRDSSGKAGWINTLFRSGSSWSSRGSGSFGAASGSSKGNCSLAATGSGALASGGSNSSKHTTPSGQQ